MAGTHCRQHRQDSGHKGVTGLRMSETAQVTTPMEADAPIGVFDSGIGGLSVLRHIRAQLPHEQLLYFADSGFVPYGEKTEEEIAARARAITGFLMQYRVKAIVVACNTATAAAIKALRETYPTLPLVGVEPGLKPAATISKTGVVGVLATRSTLASEKFNMLREQITAATNVNFLPQPCVGLVEQVEKGELHSPATAALVKRYVAPLLEQGADTLVLGCTHYPFILPLIKEVVERVAAHPVTIIDTGEPIARQLARLLDQNGLMNRAGDGSLVAFTSGSVSALENAFSTLLQLQPQVYPTEAQV